jgi:hypothetical protein
LNMEWVDSVKVHAELYFCLIVLSKV